MKSYLVLLICLMIILGSACTAVPEPIPTQLPISIAADVVTVPPRPSPTATAMATEIIVTETAVLQLP